MRLAVILVVGTIGIVTAHTWQNEQLRNNVLANELANRADKLSHGNIDEAVMLIERATDLAPRNPNIWYAASGIYAMKAMTVFQSGTTTHYPWVEKSIDAARNADGCSNDWFYTKDVGDSLLFAFVYEYRPIDLIEILSIYNTIDTNGDAVMERHMHVRREFVKTLIEQQKEFFKHDENDSRSYGGNGGSGWLRNDRQPSAALR